MWRMSLTFTPRPVNASRAASMSVTTRCMPRTDPAGTSSLMPMPKATEHADPGGANCTTRNWSLAWWSTSRWKPQLSA